MLAFKDKNSLSVCDFASAERRQMLRLVIGAISHGSFSQRNKKIVGLWVIYNSSLHYLRNELHIACTLDVNCNTVPMNFLKLSKTSRDENDSTPSRHH